jgi:hypothetical protein
MPTTIHMSPAWPADTTTVPADRSWVDGAWAEIDKLVAAVPNFAWYTIAGGILLLGLISSMRIALGARTATTRRVKSDKFLTFLAAGVATGVVATGMWKFFGDVLHIANPAARGALFAFFEIAMLASAFRSRRFRLDRAAKHEDDPDHVDKRIDVDGIAVWVLAALSGMFAAADEPTTTGKLVRVVAPLLAAWMWERGLAGELMQFNRSGKRLNLRLTTERVLVWLRIAEPAERAVGDVDRKRRVAQFARTAYRLHLLTEQDRTGWRVSWVRWRLRRQTEAANERLKLATDPVLLGEVRAQLALLYGAEAGTSRAAVSDLNPLTPAPRLALTDRPHETAGDTQRPSQDVLTGAITGEVLSEPPGSHRRSQTASQAGNGSGRSAEIALEDAPAKAAEGAAANGRKPSPRPAYPLADHPNESVRRLAKAFSRKPAGTNAELARLAKVSPGTANRYMADVRSAFASQPESDSDSQERVPGALIPPTFALPNALVTEGVNGNHPTTPEEN